MEGVVYDLRPDQHVLVSTHGQETWYHENELEFDEGPGEGYHWAQGPEAYVNVKGVKLQDVESRPNSGVKNGHVWSPWEIVQYDKGKRYIHGTNDREGWIFPEAFLENLHIGDRVQEKNMKIIGTITKMTVDHVMVLDADNQPHQFDYHNVVQAPKPTLESDPIVTDLDHVCPLPRRRLVQQGARPIKMTRPWDLDGAGGDPRAWDFSVESFFFRLEHQVAGKPTGEAPRNLFVIMPEIVNFQTKGLEAVDLDFVPKALPNRFLKRENPFSKVTITPEIQIMFDEYKKHIYEVIHRIFGNVLGKHDRSQKENWNMRDLHDFFTNQQDDCFDFMLTKVQEIQTADRAYKYQYPVAFSTVNMMYESFRDRQKLAGIGSKPFIPTPDTKTPNVLAAKKHYFDHKRPNLKNLFVLATHNAPLYEAQEIFRQHGGFHDIKDQWKADGKKFPKGFVKLIKAYIVMVCMGEYRGSALAFDWDGYEFLDEPQSPHNWLSYDPACRKVDPADIAHFRMLKRAGIIPDDMATFPLPGMNSAPAPVGQQPSIPPIPPPLAGSLGALAKDIDLNEWPLDVPTGGTRSRTPVGGRPHSAYREVSIYSEKETGVAPPIAMPEAKAPVVNPIPPNLNVLHL